MGDGNIISGVHKGLRDLMAIGLIERMPRLIGVQAEGSAALYNAWRDGVNPAYIQPVDANTVADSISAGLPRDPVKAMNAVVETDGAYITVSDEEIIAAIPRLARASGVFAEPAAAASYAGLIKARAGGVLGADEETVLLITGNGLKDIASAQKSVPAARTIPPALEAVDRFVHEVLKK